MVIIETSLFTRRIKELMSDEDYKDLQEALVNRPDRGVIIQGTGGLRKIRWKLEGQGKSGGVSVIYYWVTATEQLYMLLVYPKSEQDSLSPEQKKTLKMIVERWTDEK
jgi:mRNA-degrading endonuclease RelE of RelBE toxin-antitoxin system